MACFFLETGRFSKKNREAIKHEPGNRREGFRGLDGFLQKQITERNREENRET